ncbi:MAG: Ppx/GppA family phosphatase [Xylanivirga thermophila]|jgi:exopolyphosphatase / guanosine-5'-triphosphate,3'-diphosphate pyrophosphatase|uniref:Ppx/GppA phosphatase family protein n=1 Tax=Xylanivirga thermophila TaxID=2496273 RepID=UPI0039F636F6
MKRKAVIDIGTNSVRLIIADVDRYNISPCYKDIKTTRIGQGLSHTKKLSDGPMQRTIYALKEFLDIVDENNVSDIRLIATSAVRDALNRDVFLNRVKDELGFDIEVLSGKQEAYLEFAGGTLDWKTFEGTIVLIDVGGGSTEVMSGYKGELLNVHSTDLGAVRLMEMFPLDHPINEYQWFKMGSFIRDTLKNIVNIKKGDLLIGTGGTITTLAAIHQGLEEYASARVHGHEMTLADIKSILSDLYNLSPSQRRHVKGLQPSRSDIILAGINIVICVMERLKIDRLRVSDRDILEGALMI